LKDDRPMKTSAIALTVALIFACPVHARDAKPPLDLKDPQARKSYVVGLNLGQTLKKDGVVVDPAVVARGVRDAMAGGMPAMTDTQIDEVLAQLQTAIEAHRAEEAKQLSARNRAEGAAFLKANAAKSGVVALPSGLQYQVLTAGSGPKPKLSDTITCHYRGTLLNGTEFDSSDAQAEPPALPVGQIIKGWSEALQLMPVGSKWRLFVPAELAYGDEGAGNGTIPPGATLIFDVELLSIKG
jgi:FKBP-type peptidyl-prolyl cis-trans isomerase